MLDPPDIRPDWVKKVLGAGLGLTGYQLENGRWAFELRKAASERETGLILWRYSSKTSAVIPSIWNGEKWLDLREQDGRELYTKLFPRMIKHCDLDTRIYKTMKF